MKITIQQSGRMSERIEHEFTVPGARAVAGIADPAPLLQWLFRQFNRVDGNEFISLFDFQMPSLSVDDVVILEDTGVIPIDLRNKRTFVCAPCGWEEVYV